MIFKPNNLLGPNIVCFTTSVIGGVSHGPYSSLNLGAHVGDNKNNVNANRRILKSILFKELEALKRTENSLSLDSYQFKWLNQEHTANHQLYESVKFDSNLPCDSISTMNINNPLVVMTADCMPIVISSTSGRISAIHAGWKGLLSNVIGTTIKYYAKNESLNAWIGPSICEKHFEITHEVVHLFDGYSDFLTPLDNNKFVVDLVGIAKKQLLSFGIKSIEASHICTYDNQHCFSHRRATHRNIKNTGRMATVIMRAN